MESLRHRPKQLKIKGYIMYYQVEGLGFMCLTPINTHMGCLHKSLCAEARRQPFHLFLLTR